MKRRLFDKLRWGLLAMLLVALPGWATFQRAEQLMVDGRPVDLLMFPLSPWLADHPDALPDDGVTSTGNWRGYVGHWEISDGQLWLAKITVTALGPDAKVKGAAVAVRPDGTLEPGDPSETVEIPTFVDRDILQQLFPGSRRVVAHWFTGTLVAALESEGYIHYGTEPRRYIVIWVDRGVVGRRMELDEGQFEALLRDRFASYKRTPAYLDDLAEAREYSDDPEESVFWNAREDYLATDFAQRPESPETKSGKDKEPQ